MRNKENKGILDLIWTQIEKTYENLKALPKPERYQIGGTYYGSTELYSSVGNHLELSIGQSYISYEYGGVFEYSKMWGIIVGSAYKTDQTKKLMEFIREHKEELFREGYAIIDDYGTNYCAYGIAKR